MDGWGSIPNWEGIFLFAIMSRPALGATKPPIKCIVRTLSLGVKWSGHKAEHLPPSSAKVKNEWIGGWMAF
jgi:hypothetical protein